LFPSSEDDSYGSGAVKLLIAAPEGGQLQGAARSKRTRIGSAQIIVWSQVSVLNQKDFETLALPLLDPLYNFARWMCGDGDEARDLVQETFVKALKALPSFREGTNFRAWMFKILRNTFLTSRTGLERRSTVQESEEGFSEVVATQETPELALVRRADTELVRQGIATLPAGFKEVLILADLEELKYQEIADALDIPIGTVMSRLARARKLLRQYIVEAVRGKKTDIKISIGAKS
jgi:RNA polymerase sigma-70 factor, ECF subfamily